MTLAAHAHTENPTRRWFGTAAQVLEVPNLAGHQVASFERFLGEGIAEVFGELFPVADHTGKNATLELAVPLDGPLGEPKHSEDECRDRDLTYSAPMYADARLTLLRSGEIKESRVFLGDFPIMTPRGTFVVNGTERVVVSQLVRSPGVYFTAAVEPVSGMRLYGAKVIPARGAWLELDTSAKGVVSVKVDRKRKFAASLLLAALDGDKEALLDVHRRLRPGEPATPDSARSLMETLFHNPRRYDLSSVGRHKVDRRLGSERRGLRVLTPEDIRGIVGEIERLNETQEPLGSADDIDHLGNRRVRSAGELIQNQFRLGILRLERSIRERMTIQDPEESTPATLLNVRPLVAAM